MKSFVAYLGLLLAVHVAEVIHDLSKEEYYAAIFWPVVFIFIRGVISSLEEL